MKPAASSALPASTERLPLRQISTIGRLAWFVPASFVTWPTKCGLISQSGPSFQATLAWGAPPAGTLSLALVMDDPDAVPVAGYVWDHWVIFNLPPEAQGLPEGLGRGAQLPDGSQQGLNSFRQLGYDGPCPPAGQSHRYVFRLYALDTRLTLGDKTSKADLLQAAEGHILAQTELAGVFPAP